MSATERRKGLRGEAEVRRILEAAGFTVRGLEAGGDHLAVRDGLRLHLEVKRCETLRLPAWTRQAMRDAPADAIPVVAYRRSHEAWAAAVLIEPLALRLEAHLLRDPASYALHEYNGAWWALMPLGDLVEALR